MSRRKRPAPEPIMMVRLRQIWVEHPDEISPTLLGEIARLHNVLRSVDRLSAAVATVWLAERGGRLSAMHQMNLLLEKEPAVMEQKVRRSPRGVAPNLHWQDEDEEDHTPPHIELDGPYR